MHMIATTTQSRLVRARNKGWAKNLVNLTEQLSSSTVWKVRLNLENSQGTTVIEAGDRNITNNSAA
jgi:hypothetical protein